MDSTDLELKKVDEEAFSKALAVAAVDFADADDEVSGTSLSGGQQARLALARAMYKALVGKDVCACVLDDVTAALDPQVWSNKWEQVFKFVPFGAEKTSASILVKEGAYNKVRSEKIWTDGKRHIFFEEKCQCHAVYAESEGLLQVLE